MISFNLTVENNLFLTKIRDFRWGFAHILLQGKLHNYKFIGTKLEGFTKKITIFIESLLLVMNVNACGR